MLWFDERKVGQSDMVAALVFLLVFHITRLIIWLWKHKYGIFWFATYVLLSCGSYALARMIFEP